MAERKLRLRSYSPADEPACVRVFDSNVPAYFRDSERDEFRSFLAALPGPYFVVENDAGEIVACGGYALTPGTSTADLCWGMVRQDLHRHGVGGFLTVHRLAEARRDPAVSALQLVTSQHTTGFYERLGFTILEVTRNGFAPGLDRCAMRLELSR